MPKAFTSLPTKKELLDRLHFDLDEGTMIFKPRPIEDFSDLKVDPYKLKLAWDRKWAGQQAFTGVSHYGYRVGCVMGLKVGAHRILFKFAHGYDPEFIDHINGNRLDNRIDNLRSVTRQENNRNMALSSRNTSGVLGVYLCSKTERYVAHIRRGGKNTVLGNFSTIEEATEVRRIAAEKEGYSLDHGRNSIPILSSCEAVTINRPKPANSNSPDAPTELPIEP